MKKNVKFWGGLLCGDSLLGLGGLRLQFDMMQIEGSFYTIFFCRGSGFVAVAAFSLPLSLGCI